MDLVVGSGHSCLQVLTERKTRKELIFKIPNKDLRKHKKNFIAKRYFLRGRKIYGKDKPNK